MLLDSTETVSEFGDHHVRARQHEAAGRYGQALEVYLEAIRARRQAGEEPPPLLYLSVADLLRRLGVPGAAEDAYRRVRREYLQSGDAEKAAGIDELLGALYGGPEGEGASTGTGGDDERGFLAEGDTIMDSDRLDEVMSELEAFLDSKKRDADSGTEGEADLPEADGEAVEEEPRERAGTEPPAWPGTTPPEESDNRERPSDRPDAEPEAGGPDSGQSVSAGAGATGLSQELGEEAELRRGLEVLEELIDLRPDDLDLRARRLRYLRRLGDETRRTERERELAAYLADRGYRRAARLLCRLILQRHPSDDRTEGLLASLRKRDGFEFTEVQSTAVDWEHTEDEGVEGRLRGAVRGELSLHAEALPWLYRAARKAEVDGDSTPAEAYRDYARYLRIRGRGDEACAVLSFGLRTGDEQTEGERDLRTDLAECLLERGRHEEAREHVEELARHDEAYAVVRSALD